MRRHENALSLQHRTIPKNAGAHAALNYPERLAMMKVETASVGHVLMRALYILAIVVATVGWLWLLVWLAAQLV